MKFYTIQHNGYDVERLGAFLSPEKAMDVIGSLSKAGEDFLDYKVQEYEGWATCMSWKYGEKIKKISD